MLGSWLLFRRGMNASSLMISSPYLRGGVIRKVNLMAPVAFITYLLFYFIPNVLASTDPPSAMVTNATPLAISNDASPRLFPSPDGTAVAFERAVRLNGHRDYYLCIQDKTNSQPLCSLIPQQPPRGLEPDPNSPYFPLSWSPSGSQIAVVGQPFLTQSDSDLLVYERGSDTWRNLSDDGLEGESPGEINLETQPTWSPNEQTIAVERTKIDGVGERTTSLALVDVKSAEVRILMPLPGAGTEAGIVGGMAWSPDGTRLVASILHRVRDANSDGIWLIDVSTGESQWLVDLETAETAFQGIYADLALNLLGPVVWSPDGARLMFWAGNTEKRPPSIWTFVVKAQEGSSVTPVNLPVLPNDKSDKRTLRPLQVAWSPDSTALLVLTPGRDRSALEIPLDANDPTTRMSLYLVDVGSNSSTLVGHLPVTASIGLYPAVWSSSGDVIINGYMMRLETE